MGASKGLAIRLGGTGPPRSDPGHSVARNFSSKQVTWSRRSVDYDHWVNVKQYKIKFCEQGLLGAKKHSTNSALMMQEWKEKTEAPPPVACQQKWLWMAAKKSYALWYMHAHMNDFFGTWNGNLWSLFASLIFPDISANFCKMNW